MERTDIRGKWQTGQYRMACGYYTSATTEFASTQIIFFLEIEPTT